MALSVRLTSEEEALLEMVSRQLARSKSELVREGVRELCQRLLKQNGPTPYELGQDLFGAGHLADIPADPDKRRLWEALYAKHRRLG